MAEHVCENLLCHGVDNAMVALKSTEILTRGVRGWQHACLGAAHIVLDETIADSLCRLSCRTLTSRTSLERDLLKHRVSCNFELVCILWTMAMQTIEDASFPLHHRLITALVRPSATISA